MDVTPSLAADVELSNSTASGETRYAAFALRAGDDDSAEPQAYFAIERPRSGSTVAQRAKLTGFGWLVSQTPVSSVSVFIDGVLICSATLGIPRPDIAEAFPRMARREDAGFWFEGDVPAELSPGAANLRFRITLADTVFHRDIQVTISGHEGAAAQPMQASTPSGDVFRLEFEEATFDGDLLRVSGWSYSTHDVEHVEVRVGDRAVGAAANGLTRNDVALALPDFAGALQSGFRFERSFDVAEIGGGEISITVRDRSGASRTANRIAQRVNSLRLFCDEIGLTTDGHLRGAGWAVCPSGVTAIRLEIDGKPAGEARLGLSRPDVGNKFPRYKNSLFAGYQIDCRLDGGWDGEHDVKIVALGGAGETRTIEQSVVARGLSADSRKSAAAPSADTGALQYCIDLPKLVGGQAAETVRGFLPVGGWAFARSGIDRIDVYVDGEFHARAFTGIRRDDIQAVFPEADALLSGFGILIPPQALRPGTHRIALFFRDKNGSVEEAAFTVEAERAPEGPGPWQLREKMTHAEIELGRRILQARGQAPVWTIFIPLTIASETEIALFRRTIESLERQAYPIWRVTVSLPRRIETEMGPRSAAALLRQDGAITLAFADLSHVLNRLTFLPDADDKPLADLAGPGGMLTWLRPGDRLGEDALLELSTEAAVQDRAEFLYADERRVDPADGVVKAFFKPDWSPELLLSTNYIGRVWAAAPALLARIGITAGALAAGSEHDAVLRLTEAATRVLHIPKVLCARREDDGAIADTSRTALLEAAERRALKAHVQAGCVSGTWLMTYDVEALEQSGATVSIIMPSVAARGLVKVAIESLRANTRWRNIEIIVLDNIRNTQDPLALGWKAWMREAADLVLEIDEDFNWSRFNNIGAARATGDFLLFLNDDIEITDADWLHKLLAQAQLPQIGVVGPQLLYPDGRVQHAGVFLGHRVGRHAFRFLPKDAPGPFGLALTQRNVISVTGACMLMRRAVYEQLGGFDERHPIINNDLDFCLRAREAGLRVLYTPHVSLVHHEMASRAKLRDDYNSAHFEERWNSLFHHGDPYFHPYLSREYEDYQPDAEPVRQFQAGHPLIAADEVMRILAVKVDHIGDFILCMPAFRRIKAHFPKAKLYVLAARASLALAELEPAIDEVIEFNFFHARSENGELRLQEEELEDLRRRLAPLRFDIAMDLRRQPDTRLILPYTGARWLAGFDQGYRHAWLDIAMEFEGDIDRKAKRNHVTTSLMQFVDVVASACTVERTLISGAVPSHAEARAALRLMPAMQDVPPAFYDRPIVCVHTGAGALNKQWPASHFAGLIDLLIAELDVSVLVIGGPDESAFAGSVISRARLGAQAFSLVGKTSLPELAVVLLGCDLYVGNDSGPKHMAAGLGVPTVGVHSGSVDAGEWGPIGPLTVTMQRSMACSPCYIAKASDCPRSMACLQGLVVGDVFRACRRMIALCERPRMGVPQSIVAASAPRGRKGRVVTAKPRDKASRP